MKTFFPLFTFLLFSLTINAQIFVKADAIGNGDGTSWANAYTKLRTAIDSANIDDQLWIAAGIYKPELSVSPDSNWFEINKGLELYGGFNGTETTLDQRDWETNESLLSADILGDDVAGDFDNFKSDNAAHVLRVNNAGNNIIDGIKVIGGHARIDELPNNATDGGPWRGAGIEFITDDILIRNCQVEQCNANSGAAIWGFPFSSNPILNIQIENVSVIGNNGRFGSAVFQNLEYVEIQECLFENNFGIEFSGGLLIGNSNALIEDCTFQTNEVSPNTVGAGAFFYQNSACTFPNPKIELKSCDFLNNLGGAGSGITMNNFYPGSKIEIDSCYFYQNSGYYNGFGGGAGVLVQNLEDNFGGGIPSSTVEITNSLFEENGGDAGGAVFLYSTSDTMNIVLDKNEFIGNVSADQGGALYLFSTSYMEAELRNLKLSENDASPDGSNIYIEGAQVRLENSLIHSNLGFSAIHNRGDLLLRGNTIVNNNYGLYQDNNAHTEIQNTILSNTTAFNYISLDNSTITSKGGNLSSDESLENFFIGFETYLDFNNTDPQLDANYVPEANSACVDGGNPDGVMATTDLLGMDRIQGNQIDIGALESQFAVELQDFKELGIDVYPNPFIEQIFISDIEGIKSIRLINLEGIVVHSFSINNELSIKGDLPVGIYFLELNDGKKHYYVKLEKQH